MDKSLERDVWTLADADAFLLNAVANVAAAPAVSAATYKCRRCPAGQNTETVYRNAQTRAADEGNSVVVTCQRCGDTYTIR